MQWLRVSFAVFLLSAVNLTAQQTTAHPHQHDIALDVSVTDKAGNPVRGLQQRDFTLLDNKQVKNLTSVHAVDLDTKTPSPPVEMVLVVDAINADVLKAQRQREGIETFLQSNGGKLPIPVSLITVTDMDIPKPTTPSLDGNAVAALLEQNITGLRTINRSTQYSESERFELSLKALDAIIENEARKPGRKLIVWVSPGWPMLARVQSSITAANQEHMFGAIVRFSTLLRLGHITLYNVVALGVGTNLSQFWYYTDFLKGVKSTKQAYPPNLALPVLAVQSGGLVLNKSNDIASAMAAEIAKTADDGRSFYVVAFPATQAERPNEYHSLEVKVDQPGLTARTRTGYYAQP